MLDINFISLNGILFNNGGDDILIDDKHFKSLTFEVLNYLQNSNLEVNTLEVSMIYSDTFKDADTTRDLLQNAKIVLYRIQNNNLSIMFSGVVSDISTKTSSFTFKVKSDLYKIAISPVKRYSQKCRALFCDSACKLSIENYTYLALVKSVNGLAITLENELPKKNWSGGTVKILKNNQPISMAIRSVEGLEILLWQEAVGQISAGDSISVVASCDKSLNICSEVYNNAINFQGEPFIGKV